MRSGSPALPARLRAAIGVAALAVPFAALAPLIGSVSPAMPPAYPSWLVLALVSALPPVLALFWARRGEVGGAAGILRAAAVLAPGLLLIDAQLLLDPLLVSRPELFRPVSLTALSAGPGLYALLLSRLLVIVAGVLARSGEAEARDVARSRPGLMFGALAFAGLIAVPLVLTPFVSTDAFLPAKSLATAPGLVITGTLVLVGSVLYTAGYFAAAADPAVARGGLAGLITASAGLVLVPLISALATPGLSLGSYQVTGLVFSVLGMVVMGVFAWVAGRREDLNFEFGLAGHQKLQLAAGILAAVAGLCAVIASGLPIARLASGAVQPVSSARMLLPAGFILLALGLLVIFQVTAATVRPALAVAWVVLPATAIEVLDTAFSQVSGLEVVVLASALVVVAMGCAAMSGLLALLAGGVEREDTVDLSELRPDRAVLIPAALAGLLALGAYLLPVVVIPDFPSAALSGPFRVESWGLLLGLIAVGCAVLLAPRSRPARAAALLVGAALVVALRVAELPVRGGGSAGIGLYLGLAALLGLLAGAGIAWSRRSSATSGTE